ncbi:MAG: transglutaminase family protein [Muribaculum sp.]|nr:transglutaminase family protein [Muribaculum sp.]
MRRYAWRLVPYLGGVLGSYGIVRALVTFFYEGEPVGGRALLLCCALWTLLWTRAYGLLYLFSAVAVLLCPVLHISLTWQDLCLLFCSFVSARAWNKHQAVFGAGAVAAVCLTAGAVLGYGGEEAVTERIFGIDHSLSGWYGDDAVGEGWFENGIVSRGNSYCSGTVDLDVALDQKPTEPLYMRGYVGADYQGSRWAEAQEDSFYSQYSDLLQYSAASSMKGMHDNLYFLLNYGSMHDWTKMVLGQNLSQEGVRKAVLKRRDARSRQYAPYFSFYATSAGQFYRPEEGLTVDTYFYYEFADMDAAAINESRAWFPRTMEQVRGGYDYYAQKTYLQVPEKRIPRLAALCKENELSSEDEVTDFIRETLQADTVYTRTPGNTPVNEDVIEYFMFENKKGYCMHYASAAVLMYRLYGVPARYVSGYVAYPEDFERQEDGTYAASLNDYRRHAWVEIYSEDFGWRPVEMTPLVYYAAELSGAEWMMPERVRAAAGGAEGGQPGAQDAGEEDEEEDEEGEEEDEAEDEEEDEAQEEQEDQEDEDEEAEGTEGGQAGGSTDPGLLMLGAGAVAAGLAAGVWFRRRWNRRRLQKADPRQLFYRLLKLLHMRAELAGYTGVEEDFEEKLSGALSSVTAEETAAFLRIVREAAYGPERPLEEEERRSVYLFYGKAVEELCGQMNPFQRLYCAWILNVC